MNLRSSVETQLIREGFDLDTVSNWLGNSPDVARKHYLKITPGNIAKVTAMVIPAGTEQFANSLQLFANRMQNGGEPGSRISENPDFLGTSEHRGVQKYTRRDSNPQPSVPKTDALSN